MFEENTLGGRLGSSSGVLKKLRATVTSREKPNRLGELSNCTHYSSVLLIDAIRKSLGLSIEDTQSMSVMAKW